MYMTIGEVIRARRKAEGLSLADLSDPLEIDGSNLSRKERGIADFTSTELEVIAGKLRTTVSTLYTECEKGGIDKRKIAWDKFYAKLDKKSLDAAFRLLGSSMPESKEIKK
ncbi:hypothetical protein LCGC14_3014770 [marine sediment metagenome]|uniref:HTH cro/C1-type domain-containing protein n=1 Tax=marine sediment metagenome TaxID=412755 RepID=A0A0F8Z4U9_9ZZZZ